MSFVLGQAPIKSQFGSQVVLRAAKVATTAASTLECRPHEEPDMALCSGYEAPDFSRLPPGVSILSRLLRSDFFLPAAFRALTCLTYMYICM